MNLTSILAPYVILLMLSAAPVLLILSLMPWLIPHSTDRWACRVLALCAIATAAVWVLD